MNSIRDFEVSGKTVLVRADFNVPLDNQGNIADDYKIVQTLPTIRYLLEKGAKVVLMSHLGRPSGKEKKFSLRPIAAALQEQLQTPVAFLDEIKKSRAGNLALLENLRFHKDEEENDKAFAKKLSHLGDVYINDAFGASHRAHASMVGIPKHLPSFAGFLLEKEVEVLSSILGKPKKPMVAIIGGAKIETKIKVIEKFLEKADHLLLGGKIANTILDSDSLLSQNPKAHLPADMVSTNGASFDIGPKTIQLFCEIIASAKTIFWSGPLGKFEKAPFDKGTREIAEAIVGNNPAFKVAGGGDTDCALQQFGLREKFDHVSTGGGAMLEFLSGEKLPGLEALK